MTAKELREKRAKLIEQIRGLDKKRTDEKRADFSSEEKNQFSALETEIRSLTESIQERDRVASLLEIDDKRDDGPIGRHDSGSGSKRSKRERQKEEKATDEHRALALTAWVRKANNLPLRREHIEACRRTGMNPSSRRIDVRLCGNPKFDRSGQLVPETRDMGVGTGAGGGFTVAPDFSNALEIAMRAYNGPRQVCDVMRTSTGVDMPWPTLNDTSNEGEQIAENTAVSAQDAVLSQVIFKAWKYSSKLIPVSFELLEDSAFNVNQLIGRITGERMGRITARHYTTGTSATMPQGLAVASTLGATAASATALATDDLIRLLNSVDPAYRADPSCRFMLHSDIMTLIMMLKDTTGQPIFRASYREGEPDTLLGRGVVYNQFMASTTAATNRTVLFGAFGYYKIRDVGTVRFRRLDERYAEKDQVGFVAFMRTDGRMLNAGTGPVRHLVH
jgi:HK97 family phage major capsid protein